MFKIKTFFVDSIQFFERLPQRSVTLVHFLRTTPPDRMRSYAHAGLLELGWLGIVGIGILVMCLVWYFSALRPSENKLMQLRDKVEQQSKSGIQPGSVVDEKKNPTEQLAIFYRAFPLRNSVSASLEKIYLAAANEGLHLDQAEYKATSAIAGKLTRYQVTLPLRGGYANVHKFLVQVLKEVPTASLERVLFERKKVDDANVDANVMFVLHLGPES